MITNLSPSQLRQAADLKEKIAALEKELAGILGSPSSTTAVKSTGKPKGGMSPEGRARLVAAQKARWAKIKAAKPVGVGQPATPKPGATKGKMNAATKAKLSAKLKAYWAKRRAAKK